MIRLTLDPALCAVAFSLSGLTTFLPHFWFFIVALNAVQARTHGSRHGV